MITLPEPVLIARGIKKQIHDGERLNTILDGVELELLPGERVALVGPSGSGKSTLLHILGALDPGFQGDVTIAGQALSAMGDSERSVLRNHTLGFVFQAYNLLGHLSTLENIMLPAFFSQKAPDINRAMSVLAEVGLGDMRARKPQTLSGGEKQRVAIARALYHRPKLVLCDEPTGNLDEETASGILQIFGRLSEEGVSLLIATHDAAIASSADRVLTLHQGKLS